MSGHDFALVVFVIFVALISQSCMDSTGDSVNRRCMLELLADFITAVIVAMVLSLLLVGASE